MKKFGFTVAEILITLGIIGVVAAISLPLLNTEAQERANLAILKSTVSDFENAFSAMMLSEGKETLTDVEDWNSDDKLSNFMKISNGKTKNGTSYSFNNNTLTLDVNGDAKPNKCNIDKFELTVDDYGFIERNESCSTN